MEDFRAKILELDDKLLVLCLDYGVIAQVSFVGSGPSRTNLTTVFKALTTNLEPLLDGEFKERNIAPVVQFFLESLAQSNKRHELDMIVFYENGEYRAQGLQIDFLVRGKTLSELFTNLIKILSENLQSDGEKKLHMASEYFFLKWSDMRAARLANAS